MGLAILLLRKRLFSSEVDAVAQDHMAEPRFVLGPRESEDFVFSSRSPRLCTKRVSAKGQRGRKGTRVAEVQGGEKAHAWD